MITMIGGLLVVFGILSSIKTVRDIIIKDIEKKIDLM
jgi:hypothetical protein